MNSSEKLEFEKLAGYYGDLDANGDIINEGYAQTYNSRLAEVRRGVDTYWMSEPLRFAVSHSHDLFVEGGDERMRYGLGFNYNKTQGVMKGSDKDVLNGNVRLIYRYKTLAFTNYMNVDYSFATRENVAFSQFSRANPYYRKTNEYGEAPMILQSYGTGTSMPMKSNQEQPTRRIFSKAYPSGQNSPVPQQKTFRSSTQAKKTCTQKKGKSGLGKVFSPIRQKYMHKVS